MDTSLYRMVCMKHNEKKERSVFDFHFCESVCSVLMNSTINTKAHKTPNLCF